MIAVDTSAILAILQREPEADRCMQALKAATHVVMSAATLVELLIVANRRNIGEEAIALVEGMGFAIVAVDGAIARRVAAAHDRWGRGVHPAGLNFGDCFAYDLATHNDCPLLYVGSDFALTDVRAAV